MKLLGIDWGTQHIGVAMSDHEGLMAFPLKIVPAEPQAVLFTLLNDTIRDEGVGAVVVGVPVGTEREAQAREFILKFSQQVHIPVHEHDESRSTKYVQHMAHGDKKSRAIRGNAKKAFTTLRDAFSAALILQAFIDSKNSYSPNVALKGAKE